MLLSGIMGCGSLVRACRMAIGIALGNDDTMTVTTHADMVAREEMRAATSISCVRRVGSGGICATRPLRGRDVRSGMLGKGKHLRMYLREFMHQQM
mgnify:CR=1 FL=1